MKEAGNTFYKNQNYNAAITIYEVTPVYTIQTCT
jgi:hypothetical protein